MSNSVAPWTAARQASLSISNPRACSNSCPLSQWCRPIISSSVIPFSSCLQCFSASGSFPMSQFFAPGVQNIEASASVLSVSIQDWFPLGWTGLISLLSKGLSRVFSNTKINWSKASILQCSAFFRVQLSYPYMTTGKTIALIIWTFVGKVMSLLLDDHYIYHCEQPSLRRNRVALTSNERVWDAVLVCNLKNDRMTSVRFEGKLFNITVIQV